ncbi:bifunctional DNA primase/polymerase [Microbacterium sp. T32]|uniref:bifunctional DNA primase/polymerase n=2 Tax=Bacteria TaxID=2 RepID=UPI0007AC13D1|nr:DUF3987 domain-containing protein [Microbacterium sp. T32]KZE41416.1 hypothetical protein AVW09_02170 [Microbacterium sp. T32]
MTGFNTVADLYLERGFLPMPVRAKRPVPVGATGRNGTVTPEKVADWAANGFRFQEDGEWYTQPAETANTALRAGPLEVRLDVDAYGDKQGDLQLTELEAKLGPLPLTPSSTSRGADSPARQYFFLLHEPIELVGKAADDIDIIQARHRYSLVWPSTNPDADGAPYAWYDAEGAPMDGPPDIDDLEYLPEAWVDYFRLPDAEHSHGSRQWDGEIPAVASADEERKLRAIVSMLQELPDVHTPGSGWHDTVVRAAGWLARIARSNAYALTFDGARDLLFQHTPLDESQGGASDLEVQWQSMVRATEGQYEEPPTVTRPLLEWTGFPMQMPYPAIDGHPFVAVWAHTPEPHLAPSHRRAMMDALLAAGVNETEVATLVWHSGAAKAAPTTFGGMVIDDPHGKALTLDELWAEVDAAKAGPEPTESAPPAVVEMPVVAAPAPRRLSFLTPEEREWAEARDWFGSRFIIWAQKTFSTVNLPYYRMNRWVVLSIVFGSKGVLPKKGAMDRPLNLYTCTVGRTTSGKSEALRAIKQIMRAYYLAADSPDIGGNHTNDSLPKTLIELDGKSTWFNLDEAHTKIPIWRRPGNFSELPGIITAVYDGEVGKVFRNTNADISGKDARSYLTVSLMGTPQGMADVMGPEDWESGFLNRFVWAIGDAPDDSIATMAGDWVGEDDLEDDEAVNSGKQMYQQWAAEFGSAVMKVARQDNKPVRMKMPREVIDRHKTFVADLARIGHHGPYADRLRPTFRRLNETILRCAALVALSSGRARIEIGDLLVALEQAEEWATNILTMVEATDESFRTREVNMIERAVLDNGGVMLLQQIHGLPRFRNRRRDVLDLIEELIAQGRATWMDGTKTTLIAKGVVTGG